MPYAVFSKRTQIISRIVHDLTTLLPSESSIEVTDDIAFPRSTKVNVNGQRINTSGLRLFDEGGGVPTIKPYYRAYDSDDRPYHVKNEPMFISAVDLDDNPIQEFVDVPIYVDPFSWTASELAQVKYESILAENYPYQVVIGEEFITEDHIDTGNSQNYTITEGKCMLQPGGILRSEEFKFYAPKRVTQGAATSVDEGFRYIFDTYYFTTEPEFPEGVLVTWDGRSWSTHNMLGAWNEVVTDAERPTITDLAPTVLVPLEGMVIRIQNLTMETFEIENYMLFLRLRTVV